MDRAAAATCFFLLTVVTVVGGEELPWWITKTPGQAFGGGNYRPDSSREGSGGPLGSGGGGFGSDNYGGDSSSGGSGGLFGGGVGTIAATGPVGEGVVAPPGAAGGGGGFISGAGNYGGAGGAPPAAEGDGGLIADVDVLGNGVFGGAGDGASLTDASVFEKSTYDPCFCPDGGASCLCVVYYQCINGSISTSGFNLLDDRLGKPPLVEICPGVQKCCREPLDNDIEPTPSVPPFTPDVNPPTPPTPPTILIKSGCGIRRIPQSPNFDNTTRFSEFPWMLIVMQAEYVGDGSPPVDVFKCGASLIHPQVALTAAHCVNQVLPSDLTVRGGEWDAQSSSEPIEAQDRRVLRVIKHPGFEKETLFNDIALLILDSAMKEAPNVDVSCLPQSTDDYTAVRCLATGWGTPRPDLEVFQTTLKKVELPIVDRSSCQKRLRTTRLGRFFQLHKSFICAGGEPGIDTCKEANSPPSHGLDHSVPNSGPGQFFIGFGQQIPHHVPEEHPFNWNPNINHNGGNQNSGGPYNFRPPQKPYYYNYHYNNYWWKNGNPYAFGNSNAHQSRAKRFDFPPDYTSQNVPFGHGNNYQNKPFVQNQGSHNVPFGQGYNSQFVPFNSNYGPHNLPFGQGYNSQFVPFNSNHGTHNVPLGQGDNSQFVSFNNNYGPRNVPFGQGYNSQFEPFNNNPGSRNVPFGQGDYSQHVPFNHNHGSWGIGNYHKFPPYNQNQGSNNVPLSHGDGSQSFPSGPGDGSQSSPTDQGGSLHNVEIDNKHGITITLGSGLQIFPSEQANGKSNATTDYEGQPSIGDLEQDLSLEVNGDGGGPLFCPSKEDPNRYIQVGIVSWGIGCGGTDTPAVYSSVPFFRDWIDDQLLVNGFENIALPPPNVANEERIKPSPL